MIEKILEMLEERRLEYEKASENPRFELPQKMYYKGVMRGYEYSKDVVQEAAKDGGWIPCSERLPNEEETKDCSSFIVTKRVRDKFSIIDFCLFGTDGEWLVRENEEVLAWQPLPTQYQKGE